MDDAMQKYLLQESIVEKMGMKRKEIQRRSNRNYAHRKQKKKVLFAQDITRYRYDPGQVLQDLKAECQYAEEENGVKVISETVDTNNYAREESVSGTNLDGDDSMEKEIFT